MTKIVCSVHDHDHGEGVEQLHLEAAYPAKCEKHGGKLEMVISIDVLPVYACESTPEGLELFKKALIQVFADTDVLDELSTAIEVEMAKHVVRRVQN